MLSLLHGLLLDRIFFTIYGYYQYEQSDWSVGGRYSAISLLLVT